MKHVTRRALSLLLALAMLCSLLVTTSFAADGIWSGTGTQEDPFLIEDAADLTKLATDVNSGTTYNGKYFKVTDDITVTDWEPIGYDSSHYFLGNFDGDGHTITINGIASTKQQYNTYKYYGLFGYTNYTNSTPPVIHDVTVAGSIDATSESSTAYVGGIVGYSAGGVFANCVSTMTLSASSTNGYAGGIAGYTTSVYSMLYNCYSTAALSAKKVGGLVAYANAGKFNYCFTTAEAATGSSWATITECYDATTWNTVSDANAWVTAANASVSAYSSVDNFWSLGSDGNPTHTTHVHVHAEDDLGVVTPPTCTEKGYTTYTCVEDNVQYKDDYIDALGHAWEAKEIIAPTCTEDGYTSYECTRCHITEQRDIVEALGHEYVDGYCIRDNVPEPTITTETVTVGEGTLYSSSVAPFYPYYYNTFAEMIYTAEEIGATGTIKSLAFHCQTSVEETTNSVQIYLGHTTASTLTTTFSAPSDLTLVYESNPNIGVNDWQQFTFNKATFDYNGTDNLLVLVITNATSEHSSNPRYYYTETVGNMTATARSDSTVYSVDTPPSVTTTAYRPNIQLSVEVCAHAHSNVVDTVAATCTTDGYTLNHCDDCGRDFKSDIVPALGHAWDEGVVTKEATCTEDGEILYTCTREDCGETRTETIEALGHNYVDGVCTRCSEKEPVIQLVTIGTGTSSNYYAPYCNNYKYSLSEMIYTAEQIGAAGTITDLAFQVASAASLSTTSVKIYMGHTSKETFSTTTEWIASTDLTLVYEGAPTLGTETGWETIPLDTEFDYNGTDNLVIAVAKSASGYSSTLKYYYTSSDYATLYRQNDNTANYADPDTTTAGTRWSYQPNLQLTLNVCPHPDKYVTGQVAATCTEAAYTTYHCDDCGKDFKMYDEGSVPLGHDWDEETDACARCGISRTWDGVTTSAPETDENGVYLISCGAELAWFRDYVNAGNYTASAKVTHNIDMGENAWTPIGGTSAATAYAGAFDGDGCTVTLNYTTTTGYQGLFSYVGATGTVKNVTLAGSINVTTSTSAYLGGIAAYNYGTIEYCVNQAAVSCTGTSSAAYVGGIVGYNYGYIRNCVNEGAVTGTSTSTYGSAYVGGIFGYGGFSASAVGSGTTYVEKCYNNGTISATASATSSSYYAAAGGIGGYWSSSSSYYRYLRNCYSTGALSAAAATARVGGIVGYVSTGNSYTATTVLTNCWYLADTASAAYIPSNTSYPASSDETTVGAKTDAELKDPAFATGSLEGYQSSGGGYPILAWQVTVNFEIGDVSDDGKINAIDAMLVLRAAAGDIILTETQSAAADVNSDGLVNSADATLILQYSIGKITAFSGE